MTTKTRKPAKVSVTEGNITKSAMRLLSQRLVSAEVDYVQRELGASATQDDIDAKVMAVRKMPWSSIVISD